MIWLEISIRPSEASLPQTWRRWWRGAASRACQKALSIAVSPGVPRKSARKSAQKRSAQEPVRRRRRFGRPRCHLGLSPVPRDRCGRALPRNPAACDRRLLREIGRPVGAPRKLVYVARLVGRRGGGGSLAVRLVLRASLPPLFLHTLTCGRRPPLLLFLLPRHARFQKAAVVAAAAFLLTATGRNRLFSPGPRVALSAD